MGVQSSTLGGAPVLQAFMLALVDALLDLHDAATGYHQTGNQRGRDQAILDSGLTTFADKKAAKPGHSGAPEKMIGMKKVKLAS